MILSESASSEKPLVSVVVVTYNRLELLKKTVSSLLQVSSYPRDRLELILTDDGSPPQVQAEMRLLPFDKFCFATKNEGLGRNTNKGLQAASGEFILQLQDDWLCKGPPDFLQAAIRIFRENATLGLIRLRHCELPVDGELKTSSTGPPYLLLRERPYRRGDRLVDHLYTDNPHLKRSELHERLGYYREHCPMTLMELDFSKRLSAASRFDVAVIKGYDVFRHIGDDHSFNPGRHRAQLRQRLLSNPWTRLPFKVVLKVRRMLRLTDAG